MKFLQLAKDLNPDYLLPDLYQPRNRDLWTPSCKLCDLRQHMLVFLRFTHINASRIWKLALKRKELRERRLAGATPPNDQVPVVLQSLITKGGSIEKEFLVVISQYADLIFTTYFAERMAQGRYTLCRQHCDSPATRTFEPYFERLSCVRNPPKQG